ncbi:MAG: DMT family transporter [Lachnospiraceae bacterium]|nr:DMT family transporter [Lachnospiraceae bacterium]
MKKDSTQLRNSGFLLIAALIWGTAFVAQAQGGSYVGGFTFTALRNYIAVLFLIPVAFLTDHLRRKKASTKNDKPSSMEARKEEDQILKQHMIGPFTKAELLGGLLAGTALCAASVSQQIGIAYTSVAKAGFLTAVYVILVPLLGIFFGHRIKPYLLVCTGLSLLGMYFLCLFGNDASGFSFGDLLEVLCSVLFAIQILLLDRYSPRCRAVYLSMVEFFVCAVEASFFMIFMEGPAPEDIGHALPALLYVGIFSSGVAYTLQTIGQKDLNPAIASLIMCLESVISAVSAWIILGQAMTGVEMFGASLMFAATVIAQIYPSLKKVQN